MCSSGAMPSQLQGTRKSLTKETGEIYITVEDKATASWIDFGCTKYWLLMALAAIAIVAVAIIVGALTVATGGLALVAIGAIAGLVGASVGLVMGALLCGQKVVSKRVWSGSKSNFIAQGTNTITGNHTMTCAAGGTVQFAPNIKTWTDAIKVAALNYANILVEAAFLGAGAGLVAAFATGAIVLAVPTVASVLTNTAILAGAKTLSGASNYSNKDALGQIHNSDEAWKAASPEYEAATRIYSNGLSSVSLNDVLLFGGDMLIFLHVKAKAPAPSVGPEPEVKTPSTEENVNSPKEEANTPKDEPAKADEDTVAPEAEAKPAEGEGTGKTEDAYEDGVSSKAKGDIGEAQVIEDLKADGYTDVVQVQNNSGHGVDVIARNPLTGEVKCVEVKANSSKLSPDQQKGGEWYVENRLQRAVDGEGHYKVPPNPAEMKADALKAQEWIEDAPKVDYEVHNVKVDNATGEVTGTTVKPWNPKP